MVSRKNSNRNGDLVAVNRLSRWSNLPTQSSANFSTLSPTSESKKLLSFGSSNKVSVVEPTLSPLDHDDLKQGSLYIVKIRNVSVALFEGWEDDMCCFAVLRSDATPMRWSEARYIPGDFDTYDAFDDAGNPPVHLWTRHLHVNVPINWFSIFEEARRKQREWIMEQNEEYYYPPHQPPHRSASKYLHGHPAEQHQADINGGNGHLTPISQGSSPPSSKLNGGQADANSSSPSEPTSDQQPPAQDLASAPTSGDASQAAEEEAAPPEEDSHNNDEATAHLTSTKDTPKTTQVEDADATKEAIQPSAEKEALKQQIAPQMNSNNTAVNPTAVEDLSISRAPPQPLLQNNINGFSRPLNAEQFAPANGRSEYRMNQDQDMDFQISVDKDIFNTESPFHHDIGRFSLVTPTAVQQASSPVDNNPPKKMEPEVPSPKPKRRSVHGLFRSHK